ncbi:large ribosomal subunit protein eL20-like [Oscarella lobularis]|uniref:large ribosomal subunit protein eL20-like n=1 Tax=Oscarella lobularis TaxID=121494 RepID=UPI0033138BD4
MKVSGNLREYRVIGRRLPSEKLKHPPIYQMRIFAPNDVSAKSRFWYFMKKLRKLKKTVGEVVSCEEIFAEKKVRIKNYGIWLRYDSRSGTHNMYREYRDVTVCGAVTLCYRDMAARHRARGSSIQIIKVQEVKASDCKRAHTKQFHDYNPRFPLPHRIVKAHFKTRFAARRPNTHF